MLNIGDNLQLAPEKAYGQRFAVLGKSGSGKTNTLYVLAEEWLRAGWPFTAIDQDKFCAHCGLEHL